MSKLALEIISECAALVHDEASYTRWSKAEWTDYMDAAQRELAKEKPDAFIKKTAYRLVAGTSQQLPDGTSSFTDPDGATLPEGIHLMEVSHNMGTDGETPGGKIEIIDKAMLDSFIPGWRAVIGDAVVQNYMVDDRYPKKFEVYPPQPVTAESQGYVGIVYEYMPPIITRTSGAGTAAASDAVIDAPDIHIEDLKNFMFFKAYNKGSNYAANFQKAQSYLQLFYIGLGKLEVKQLEKSANTKADVRPQSPSLE